ncbi:hypothetical protein Pelo_13643 [Pelomyxa schiedti]|nr:hypothetical protein Pelo_13643 [Pelomyxa schiedti]
MWQTTGGDGEKKDLLTVDHLVSVLRQRQPVGVAGPEGNLLFFPSSSASSTRSVISSATSPSTSPSHSPTFASPISWTRLVSSSSPSPPCSSTSPTMPPSSSSPSLKGYSDIYVPCMSQQWSDGPHSKTRDLTGLLLAREHNSNSRYPTSSTTPTEDNNTLFSTIAQARTLSAQLNPAPSPSCRCSPSLHTEFDDSLIALGLSTSKIYRFKTEEMWIEIPRSWRLSHLMDESVIFQAGLAAKCCRPGSSQEVTCSKCLHKKVVTISVTSLHPFYHAPSGMEKYPFSIKSLCTSSRDHLRTALVATVSLPNCSKTLQSKPFHILSRCYKKDTPGPVAVKQQPSLGPLLVNPDINFLSSTISVVVRLVLIDMDDLQTEEILRPVSDLMKQYAGGGGFLGIQFRRLSSKPVLPSPPTDIAPACPANIWAAVASFKSLQDAVSALSFYDHYAKNRTRNPFNCDLDSMGKLKSVVVITNF